MAPDVAGSGGQSDPLSVLEAATRMIAATQLELETKGFAPSLVRAAIERARGVAQYKAQPISAAIQGQAFLDLLRDELTKAEDWVQRQKKFLDNEGEPEPE